MMKEIDQKAYAALEGKNGSSSFILNLVSVPRLIFKTYFSDKIERVQGGMAIDPIFQKRL